MVGPRPDATAAPRFEPGPPGPGSSKASGAHIGTPRTRLVKPTQVGVDHRRGIGVRTGHLVNARPASPLGDHRLRRACPVRAKTGKGGGRAAAVPPLAAARRRPDLWRSPVIAGPRRSTNFGAEQHNNGQGSRGMSKMDEISSLVQPLCIGPRCLDDLRSLGKSMQALDRPPELEVGLREHGGRAVVLRSTLMPAQSRLRRLPAAGAR
jgi:hypothetical protein